MIFKKLKAKAWTSAQIRKNNRVTTPINCEAFIHPQDKLTLDSLKKIPLLETVCGKILSALNDSKTEAFTKTDCAQITQKQFGKIYKMVQSICNKIGIVIPKLYLKLDGKTEITTFGATNFTIIIHSGILDKYYDDEIYTMLAHECGHIACKHTLYHSAIRFILDGGEFGLKEIGNALNKGGLLGSLVGDAFSLGEDALETAFLKWLKLSELSADRIAIICCNGDQCLIETLMLQEGASRRVIASVNKKSFIEQAVDYDKELEKNKVNKAFEFFASKTKDSPMLASRLHEAQKFALSDEYKTLLKTK